MEITTPRLTLRPVRMSDLHTTHAYAGHLENTRFMMYLPYASIEETEEVLREAVDQWQSDAPERLEFAICLGGVHIGGITLYFQGAPDEAELGWVLHRDHWRRGYVTEAARALMDYARQERGIRRIFACCDSENAASRGVMEKLGMQLVKSDGRRHNRSMAEERIELTYEIRY
ncbi:MAG: GNAT family N-acetyltransferase [Clostridia bacterium]|nr:GNAT family N-acetyltransferase [Clostridia bacterium]